MFLLTSSGTFTASQYESITESTKLAIDGLLDVFSRLAPLYALLCVLGFGVAFVILLFHIVSHGGDMEKATAPLSSSSSKSDILDRANAILNGDDEFARNMRSEDFFRKYYDPDDDTYRKRQYYNW